MLLYNLPHFHLSSVNFSFFNEVLNDKQIVKQIKILKLGSPWRHYSGTKVGLPEEGRGVEEGTVADLGGASGRWVEVANESMATVDAALGHKGKPTAMPCKQRRWSKKGAQAVEATRGGCTSHTTDGEGGPRQEGNRGLRGSSS